VSTPLGYLSVFDELENSVALIKQLSSLINKGRNSRSITPLLLTRLDENMQLYEQSLLHMERCKTLLTQSRLKGKQGSKGAAKPLENAIDPELPPIPKREKKTVEVLNAEIASEAMLVAIEEQLEDSEALVLLREAECNASDELEIIISDVKGERSDSSEDEASDGMILKYLTTELEGSDGEEVWSASVESDGDSTSNETGESSDENESSGGECGL
jgi:hypothetical protein